MSDFRYVSEGMADREAEQERAEDLPARQEDAHGGGIDEGAAAGERREQAADEEEFR